MISPVAQKSRALRSGARIDNIPSATGILTAAHKYCTSLGACAVEPLPVDLYRVILYEHPFNERVRNLLRLEHMFDRLFYFSQPGDARLHQVAIATLFEILDVTERSDVKGSLLQDIERQRAALTTLCGHPGAEQDALGRLLRKLEQIVGRLAAQGRTGQALRDNEWLVSLRGRIGIPGGPTQMDMPSYYAWQMRGEAARYADLQRWAAPLHPLREGVSIVLHLLRGASDPQDFLAGGGCYQQMLSGKACQLVRVWIDTNESAFPEISANKYMVWIRFVTAGHVGKPQSVPRDVPFKMALCNA